MATTKRTAAKTGVKTVKPKKKTPGKEPAASKPKRSAQGAKAAAPASDAAPGAQPAKATTSGKAAKAPRESVAQLALPEVDPGQNAPQPELAPVVLSPEEVELSAVYGDELAASGAAHQEFRDRQTADEDRPLMPEISARDERKKMWGDRRDDRHRRRQERDQERRARRDARRQERTGAGQPGSSAPNAGQAQAGAGNGGAFAGANGGAQGGMPHQARGPRPPAPRPPVAPPPQAGLALGDATAVRLGTVEGDSCATLFTGLPHAQPIPVKQLAQMLRKRGLWEFDPEQQWPVLKAGLITDERRYRALGLRPRVCYRGRDLFAPGTLSATDQAVAATVAGAQAQAAQTLTARLGGASSAGLERVASAYLLAAGYTEVEWVKRVEGISYATAIAPGLGTQILVAVRSGASPVDRRGVGELRVGVEAKNLLCGLLLAVGDLSTEAQRELERPGRAITVLCGEAFIQALIERHVGTMVVPAQVTYTDDALLDELLANG